MTRSSFAMPAAALALVACLAACGRGYQAPETQPAQLTFGVDMAQRGLWNEALFRFEQAKRLSPNDSAVWNNIAVAHEALGNFDQALLAYREALRVDRGNAEVRQNYSRFVEFYRAFQPDQGEAADRVAAGETSGDASGETGDIQ